MAVYSTPCNGLFFECTFTNSNYGEPIGTLYACYAQANYTDNKPTEVTAIRGNHTDQKSNAYVQNLQVMGPYDVGIDRIPAGISNFFPDLKIFTWDNARIKHLAQKDFKPFPNLIQVSIRYNMIKQLDGNLFKFNKKLQWIDFSSNAIQIIGKNFFDGLTELTQMMFYMNPCVGMMMMPSMNIENNKADLLWMCSPVKVQQEVEACPAQCSDRFNKIESRVSVVESKTDDLKAFLKIVYELRQ